MQNITILGSTGSIGVNTLDVLREHLDRFNVFALTAHTNVDSLFKQCVEFQPQYAVLANKKDAERLQDRLDQKNVETKILYGESQLSYVSSHVDADQVMAAIVGIAGLRPTYAAVESGKKVLLANKEVLVTAGDLFDKAVVKYGATLIPVDSEHNAIFQCLPEANRQYDPLSIEEIVLTASGGPFLRKKFSELEEITPSEACAHPNWAMGQKISVDSSTMMNKALEMIEAFWLFKMPAEKLKVLIHPQSIVHSMVRYKDGSYVAQLGSPDMRTPIAYALFHPERGDVSVNALDLTKKALSFEEVDLERFPIVKLVGQILKEGDHVGAIVMNAANEVLVEAFLRGRVRYLDIVEGVIKVVNKLQFKLPSSIDDVIEVDRAVRSYVNTHLLV